MKKKIWKKTIAAAACMMLFLTGCGSKSEEGFTKNEDYGYYSYDETTEAAYDDMVELEGLNDAAADDVGEEYGSADSASEMTYADGEAIVQDSGSPEPTQTSSDAKSVIDREMLVYRGELNVDTLDFATSVSTFKVLVNDKGGFVESESYTDSGSTSSYYAVDEDRKHNLYYATVRIPSSQYETIMNEATTLGDVRSKKSNVTNVTQQYSTYKSQLEIYETEYARYLTLLENATEDEYALQIENELFDIQIQIAQLKSGISNIENDVAYSYIDITIREVREYEEEPELTDTFGDRLKNTCKQAWEGFLTFLEDALFFIIRNIFGIVLIVVIIIVIRIVWKKKKAKKLAKQNIGYTNHIASENPAGNMGDSTNNTNDTNI